MRSRPLRFSPFAWQLMALDAFAGAASVTVALLLRFVDEGAVPSTYAQRLLPWLVIAAAIQVLAGEVMTRLRRPASPIARRPVAPFLVGTLVALVAVLVVNDLILREPLWHLPHFVAIVAPLLASAASAALRLAAARSIDLDELLTRPIVHLDVEACAPALTGKRVLITGAAGSIGAELTRQVLAVGPADVLAVDTNETGLYELEGDVGGVRTCISDVSDARRMRELFLRERPQVVFHAAAYKHVPLVEANPDQGFATNVLGTLAVCEAAIAAQTERVVVISTDKAVNPSSFMGLTKRVAELMVAAVSQSDDSSALSAAGHPPGSGLLAAAGPASGSSLASARTQPSALSAMSASASQSPRSSGLSALAQPTTSNAASAAVSEPPASGLSPTAQSSSSSVTSPEVSQSAATGTVLSAVRFGNVLGSRGSVVPTLLRQIDAGGPITITHPDAQRFFMTISEAASLVLLSAAYGAPGALLVLDMGDEVRIEQLAERLVRLKGLRPGRDIAITYIGLRPGEKLREELHTADEQLVPTDRPGVWLVAPAYAVDGPALLAGVRDLDARRAAGRVEPAEYPSLLRALIARTTTQ